MQFYVIRCNFYKDIEENSHQSPKMTSIPSLAVLSIILIIVSTYPVIGFDDEAESKHYDVTTAGSVAKDKVLLRDVRSLTFHRNKRTTSRRTHPIYQLACVGGTAGCKLFTPDVVECEQRTHHRDGKTYNWKCRADISDRVIFNHVDVICEGYDYPEDDYILLGSCGLEFTLDYVDPLDHHHQSYFEHLDEGEKEKQHKRVKATSKPQAAGTFGMPIYLNEALGFISKHFSLIAIFSGLTLCTFCLMKWLGSGSSRSKTPGYGPLTQAVLTTKKTC